MVSFKYSYHKGNKILYDFITRYCLCVCCLFITIQDSLWKKKLSEFIFYPDRYNLCLVIILVPDREAVALDFLTNSHGVENIGSGNSQFKFVVDEVLFNTYIHSTPGQFLTLTNIFFAEIASPLNSIWISHGNLKLLLSLPNTGVSVRFSME